jgi:GNAT superfamily N-acetyltransferase
VETGETKMANEAYLLRKPDTDSAWNAFHRIRRAVLFEPRGHGDIYDPMHPDDRAADHCPLLLWHNDAPIGVIRLDYLADGSVVTRLVAIDGPVQRRGHGRVLLLLAEAWAREHGARRLARSLFGQGWRRVDGVGADDQAVVS